MRGNCKYGSAATILVALALAGQMPAHAAGTQAAQASDDDAKIKELQRRLDQRDAVIRNLMQRVEKLEREQAGRAAATPQAAPAAAAASEPAKPAPPVQAQAQPQAQPPAAAPAGAAPSSAQSAPQRGPGEFAVSEEDAQRALERALVQTGAAVLPPWKFEFVPSFSYQFQRVSTPGEVVLTTDGHALITENVARSTQIEGNALLRVGLPWDSQAEVALPWDYKSSSVSPKVNGAGLSERSADVQGLGDVALSLTKQILNESDVRPGVLVSGTWNSNTGQVKRNIPLGTGFNELTGGVTVVKRQDPLVFTAGFNYQYTFEHNGVKLGDQYTPAVGLLFAVSPETSLRFGQQVTFGRKNSISGTTIPGSEKTEGIFTFGLLSILGRGFVVNFSAGIGETHDAPDMFFQLSFPIRLN